MSEEQKLINAIRKAIATTSPQVNGAGRVDRTTALTALATVQSYLVAAAPAHLRQHLLAHVDDIATRNLAELVERGHEIVGAGVVIARRRGQ